MAGSVHDQVVQIIGTTNQKASVETKGTKGALAVELVDGLGNQITNFTTGLVTVPFDYIQLSNYDGNGNPGLIIYKSGGAGGTTVATLTLTYAGLNILTITKT